MWDLKKEPDADKQLRPIALLWWLLDGIGNLANLHPTRSTRAEERPVSANARTVISNDLATHGRR